MNASVWKAKKLFEIPEQGLFDQTRAIRKIEKLSELKLETIIVIDVVVICRFCY